MYVIYSKPLEIHSAIQRMKWRKYCRILSMWDISEGALYVQQETMWKKIRTHSTGSPVY
jgi:hypothetical protein